MPALRVSKCLLLGTLMLIVWARAYFASAMAASVDSRLPWALPLFVGLALGGQCAAAWLARRWPSRWARLSLDDTLLLWILAGLGLQAQSHVAPETTLRALREEIPAALALVHPLLVAVSPFVLRLLGRRVDAADRLLLASLAVSALAGAVHLLDGHAALMLALATLLAQLAGGDGRMPRGANLALGSGLALLFVLATLTGQNRFHALPSLAWVLTGVSLYLAVAARPRSRDDLRRLLAAPLASAVVLALCGLVVTVFLALALHWKPALATRLVLFRQHPNFLAPFYAFEALVAAGLALGAGRRRAGWWLAFVLLAASAWLTDSRAGQALLMIGVATVPVLLLLQRLATRVSRRLLLRGVLLIALVLVLGVLVAHTTGALAGGIDRFEKSMEYRVDAWSNALAVIRRWPGLGIGPGTFLSLERFAPGSRFFNEPTSPHPHNVLLYVAQSAGLPALALFVAWIAVVLAGLWRWSTSDAEGPGRLLGTTLLAGTLGLLAANQLDVGLALDSVVPEPIFLLAGLLLAARPRALAERTTPGVGLIWAGLALTASVLLGWAPIRAETHLAQASLLAFMSSRESDPEPLMLAAREAGEQALQSDPYHEPAYELVARWLEGTQQGFPRAREILLQLVDLAPAYGHGHSLLGQLYSRARMYGEASRELLAAVKDGHGSTHQSRDRASLVQSLCRLGRRDEALDQLIEALHLDVGIIDALQWTLSPQTGEAFLTLPDANQRPIALIEAVEILFGRHVADEAAGRPVGRRNWMDTYRAFRRAHRDDRALHVLDYMEAHVPAVERWTLHHERGLLALDRGDCALALAEIQTAHELTGNPYYESELSRARRRCGEALAAQPAARPALLSELVEILDQVDVFEHALRERAAGLVAEGRQAEAAEQLHKLLLFVDDPLTRAERLLEIAGLAHAGGDQQAAAQAGFEALQCLGAKPYPARLLAREHTSSLPLQLAELMFRSWRAAGADDHTLQRLSWAQPGYFSSRVSWSQYRMALFAELGQMDALQREAQLALLTDPQDLLALWFEIEAEEGLGQHRAAADSMRALSETFRETSPIAVDRIHAQLVRDGQQHQEDPHAWRDVALVDMLRGLYVEAAGLFERAATLLPEDDGRERASMFAWQARAALLSGRPDAVVAARSALQRATECAPEVGSYRRRLETLP